MKLHRSLLLWLSLALFALAILVDDWASNYPFQSKTVTVLINGQPTSKDIIETPSSSRYARLVAVTLYSLAGSVLISAFVTTFISHQRLKEHENELRGMEQAINVNVFEALFKQLVPKEIFDSVKKDILMCKMVRRDANWIFDFSYERDLIVLKQTLKYKLANATSEDIIDPIIATTEPSRGGKEKDELLKALCMIDGTQIVAFDNRMKREGVTEITDARGNKETVVNFTIPAGKTAEITLIWQDTYFNCEKCTVHRDGYFTRYPIVNGELIVNKPPDLEFDIFQSLSAEFSLILKEPDRMMYRLRGGVLPRQGFVFLFAPGTREAAAGEKDV